MPTGRSRSGEAGRLRSGAMELQETAEQQALRAELRAYFAGIMTDDVRDALQGAHETSPVRRELFRRMGRDGVLGIGWPTEYGGQGRPATDQFIFFDEAQRASCPMPFVTLNTVGPTLMEHGSAEQKAFFLPKILAGEITFAIGYSEPSAGTDLASLSTRAVRDGDEWVINGQKIFTSGANEADYVWLACRTDPDVKKHRGISLIIVPTTSPGYSWTPIVTVGNPTTTATYYDDVRVPYTNVVAGENEGWRLITTQLNHERVGLAAVGALAFRLYDDVVCWAATTPAAEGVDERVIDEPWVQHELARCKAKLDAMYLLNWRMTVDVANGSLRPQTSSAVKVFGTEAVSDIYHALLNVLGPEAHLREGNPGAVLRGEVESMGRTAQINTFGGGVNEVQREIVAWMGLGMTRTSR
jgi:alkylation response protein AidB-like acyl-CoA dehydrogenase